MDKYQELYNLAKEVYQEELKRSSEIDQKAAIYLTVLTFLIGAFAFFGNNILKTTLPPTDFIDWTLLALSAILLILLLSAWFCIFGSIRDSQRF